MPKYDVFISYRHGDPDRRRAVQLDAIFQKSGIVAAFDERDFSPQETFLDEMARCIQESTFTVALLSERYLGSYNTLEEAVMQKCLDSAERARRLLPVYLEPCEPPLWLSTLVGVRLYESSASPSPVEKLIRVLSEGTGAGARPDGKEIENSISKDWRTTLAGPLTGIGIGLTGLEILDRLSQGRKSIVDGESPAIEPLDDELLEEPVFGGDIDAEQASDVASGVLGAIKRFLLEII